MQDREVVRASRIHADWVFQAKKKMLRLGDLQSCICLKWGKYLLQESTQITWWWNCRKGN